MQLLDAHMQPNTQVIDYSNTPIYASVVNVETLNLFRPYTRCLVYREQDAIRKCLPNVSNVLLSKSTKR